MITQCTSNIVSESPMDMGINDVAGQRTQHAREFVGGVLHRGNA
jgi:hypothetical protein